MIFRFTQFVIAPEKIFFKKCLWNILIYFISGKIVAESKMYFQLYLYFNINLKNVQCKLKRNGWGSSTIDERFQKVRLDIYIVRTVVYISVI